MIYMRSDNLYFHLVLPLTISQSKIGVCTPEEKDAAKFTILTCSLSDYQLYKFTCLIHRTSIIKPTRSTA